MEEDKQPNDQEDNREDDMHGNIMEVRTKKDKFIIKGRKKNKRKKNKRKKNWKPNITNIKAKGSSSKTNIKIEIR